MFPWQATVQNEKGDIVVSPVVAVYKEDGASLADIFNAAGDALPNPFTGTTEGFVQFYVNDTGVYNIVGEKAGSLTPKWVVWLGDWSQPFPNLAAFNAAVIPAGVNRVEVAGVGAFSIGASITGIKAGWRPDGVATPAHFGAVGDGVADDGTAVRNAVRSGLPLDWMGKAYRSTVSIDETVAHVNWVGGGARFIYDGAHAQEAMKVTCGLGVTHEASDITFDANSKANVAVKFVSAGLLADKANWPSCIGSDIRAVNAYRKDTEFPGGDGLRIDGGFHTVGLVRPYVKNCFMATGADEFGVQGIFGVSVNAVGNRYPLNVNISYPHVENVWSQDPAYKNDSDGIRIFQDLTDLTGSCSITEANIINVSNRAIKLHSGINASINGVYRVLDASVIPQSGAFANPDIDAQQAPATVTNARFYYSGAWHSELVRNNTERSVDYGTGGAIVSGISGKFENVAGSAIRVVTMSPASDAPETDFRAAVSDIAIDGPVDAFLNVQTKGASSRNYVTISNATAQVTGVAVRASGTDGALRVNAANLQNTSGEVPLGAGFTGGNRLSVSGYSGFTVVGASSTFGGDYGAAISGPLESTDQPIAGRSGPTAFSRVIPSDVGNTVNDCILLLQPSLDVTSNASGEVQMRRGAASAASGYRLQFLVNKDASLGEAAGYVVGSGALVKTVQLVTCAYDGETRIGIRVSGGTLSASALSAAYFTGNYLGSKPMRLIPAASATDIAAMPQRAGLEPRTTYPHPVAMQEIILPGGVLISSGSGSPEGVKASPIGSQYLRTDGGAGTSMYVKESGTGNTGWVAK